MRSVTQLGAGAALLVLSAAQAAYADVVPTAPGPGEVFRVGQKCNIQWDLDTTGTWTSFEIQLMTGSNLNMVPLQVVGSDLDGTTGPGTIDFTCPQVTPNADIYFYQFTQAGAPTSWTTRFTIAGADGSVTEPTETTAGIAWGTGKLVGAAAAAGSGSAAGSAAAGSSSSATGGSGLASLANTKTRVAAASSSTVAAAATTTTTASSTFVTSVTSSSSSSTSSEAAVATSSDTLTSLSPAAVIVTVTSSSSTASSAVGSAASNANLRSAAGRVGVSVGAAVAAGAAALSYALLA
ncbi:hypothetical protein B0A53_03950 [Rhodotorula sp. CCFEE 5036]|nr:hypothetical protein B0A53_03950 [Rhodotorula sp. CCFEE 5036]